MLCDVTKIYLLIAYYAVTVSTGPHIFTGISDYQQCQYQITSGKKPKFITFPDKTWTINTRTFTIYFTLCKTVQPACHNRTSACMLEKATNKITDLGNDFTRVDAAGFVLESLNGERCLGHKNYTLVLNFECSDTMKANPRLVYNEEDDLCRYEATMMRPGCKPSCTDVIQGAHLIDIRNFPKIFEVPTNDTTFSLSLCSGNRNCGPEISSCEIGAGHTTPLARVTTQRLNYDVTRNELTARGGYKEGRVVKELEVLIKCNWGTELANPVFIKPPKQGTRYRFEVESSYGCVKVPHSCTVGRLDNLHYDLRPLDKLQGWHVSNMSQGVAVLNLCGPLNNSQGVCYDQYSQVCHSFDGNSINRGSILQSLEAVDSDRIRAVLVSGSVCTQNNSLYSTEVNLMCSATEKGPIFKEYRNCTMVLLWETPHACPLDYYTGKDCHMNDRLGSRNLARLHKTTDSIYSLSPNNDSRLIFNLCGPLHQTCRGFQNASFCLKSAGEEVVLGWDTRDLVSNNGLITMKLEGDTCRNHQNRPEVNVEFICNYEEPPPPSVFVVVEDSCKFNVTVYTSHACISERQFTKCAVHLGSSVYDLSRLSMRNKNYVIRGDKDIDYIFNLCGPVLTERDVLCPKEAMICLRNNTAVNIKDKFRSLGSVGTSLLKHDKLTVQARMGALCEGFNYYTSTFHFECSSREVAPMLLSKSPCEYHFRWETPEACPRSTDCEIRGAAGDISLNLTNLGKKTLNVNLDNRTVYEISLCETVYQKNDSGISNTYPLTRDLHFKDERLYLDLILSKNCVNASMMSRLRIEFECLIGGDDRFEQKSFDNCIVHMIAWTGVVCSILKQNSESKLITEPTTVQKIAKNCSVVSKVTGYELSLNRLKPTKLTIGINNYSIGFNGSHGCDSALCRNGLEMVSTDVCPATVLDETSRSVKCSYTSPSFCSEGRLFNVEFHLECNDHSSEVRLHEEGQCKINVEYNMAEVCSLFLPIREAALSITGIIGIIVGVIMVLVGSGFLIYRRKRLFTYSNIPLSCNKREVPIYVRDFTL